MTSCVLIIGAGLGGLAFAQALKKAGTDFAIFERDSTNNHRSQGYRIRLHSKGLAGLQASLLPEVRQAFEETCATDSAGPGVEVDAVTAEPIARTAPAPGQGGRPPPGGETRLVDRSTLREVLRIGIDVCYGKEFSRFETSQDGVTAFFTDGTSAAGALLVGADGVRSQVRKQYVPNLKFLDTNGRGVIGKSPLTPELASVLEHPQLSEKMSLITDQTLSHPALFLFEAIRFPQRHDLKGPITVPEDYVYWVYCRSKDDIHFSDNEFLRASTSRASEFAIKMTEHWHPMLKALIIGQDQSQANTMRFCSAPPSLPNWAASRITLLGDAAHTMSPTGGQGAVTAFMDVENLSKMLIEYGTSVKAVEAYETEMRVYAGKAVEMSGLGGKRFYGMPDWADLMEASGI